MGSCISNNNKRIRSNKVLNLSDLKIVLCKRKIESETSSRQEIFRVKDSNAPNLKLKENILWNKRILTRIIKEETCAVLVQ